MCIVTSQFNNFQEYVSASQQNEVNFLIPKLTFVFTQGITEDLAGTCICCCYVAVAADVLLLLLLAGVFVVVVVVVVVVIAVSVFVVFAPLKCSTLI